MNTEGAQFQSNPDYDNVSPTVQTGMEMEENANQIPSSNQTPAEIANQSYSMNPSEFNHSLSTEVNESVSREAIEMSPIVWQRPQTVQSGYSVLPDKQFVVTVSNSITNSNSNYQSLLTKSLPQQQTAQSGHSFLPDKHNVITVSNYQSLLTKSVPQQQQIVHSQAGVYQALSSSPPASSSDTSSNAST